MTITTADVLALINDHAEMLRSLRRRAYARGNTFRWRF